MKIYFNLILRLMIPLFAVSCATKDTRPVSGPQFQIRPYSDITLKNGLKVVLIEEKSLPFVSLGLLVRVGSRQDPEGLSGLNHLVAGLLDKGTRQHTAIELADQMAQYGGEFSVGAGIDGTYVAGSALSFYEEKLVSHFAEMVTEAAFTNVEIERSRRRQLAMLQQLADDPDAIADITFQDFLYDKHSYARPVGGRIKDVKKIAKKNIIRHYLQYYRPSNSQLAVVGKYSPEIVTLLEKAFAGWQDRPVAPVALAGWPLHPGRRIRLVDRSDLEQSQIRFGHRGIRRNNPDFVALRLANVILGGGFASRLMQEVRVKRGLTYNVSSDFETRLDEGPFTISTFTRHDKIGETVREILRVVEEYQEGGPTSVELKEAKALLKGQFPRVLETPDALASNLLYLRFYGVPDSYLSTYLTQVDRLTLADIKRVLKKYFRAEDFQILIYAPVGRAKPQVEGLAPLEVVSYKKFL